MDLLSKEENQAFDNTFDVLNVVSQIIMEFNYSQYQNNSAFNESYNKINIVAEELGCKLNFEHDLDFLAYLNKNKKNIENILDFYKSKNIWVFPQFISARKSLLCTGFVFRILNKYSKFKFDENIMFSSSDGVEYSKQFYDFFINLVKENIFIEIDIKKAQIGDIIIYSNHDNHFEHIGFVYNSDLSILSKHGHSYIYLSPINSIGFRSWDLVKIFRLNDDNFQNNFQNKFIPVIEKMKLDKDELFEYVNKLSINFKF